jgi:hypothetical protein
MIVANLMLCPDGTVIQSKHRHDFVEYTDKEGNYFMIDGGLSYQRYSNESGKGTPIIVKSDDDITLIREWMYWGKNYDENKNLLPETEWVKLKDIDDNHLNALIVYWKERIDKYEMAYKFLDVFEREKRCRTWINEDIKNKLLKD